MATVTILNANSNTGISEIFWTTSVEHLQTSTSKVLIT